MRDLLAWDADPYRFLFASLMVVIFGTGLFSVDTMWQKLVGDKTALA